MRATMEDNCNTANATARALARKIDASREASMHGAEAEEGERERTTQNVAGVAQSSQRKRRKRRKRR